MITLETEKFNQCLFKVCDTNNRQLACVQSFDPRSGEGIIYWPIDAMITIQEVLSLYEGIKIQEIFLKDSKTHIVTFKLVQYSLERVKK